MDQTTHTDVQEATTVATHHHPQHTTHRKKFTLNTPIAIIIAAVILGTSHVIYAALLSGKSNSQVTMFAGSAVTKKDYPTGNQKSDVVVVEYSDTECPFCARLHPAITQIQSEYKDKVQFVYRYFPLTQIHKNAFAEAQAIECIGQQLGSEKRREYIDKMFTRKINSNSMVLPENGKEELAKSVGADLVQFSSCLTGEESSKIVAGSIQDGVLAGVSGTPATFVLKRDGDDYEVFAVIEGAREYDYFKTVIEAALK